MSGLPDIVNAEGGAVGLLAFVVLMIMLGWLVPFRHYRQLERDRDYWRTAALKAIGHAEALLPAAQITTEVTKALSDIGGAERELGLSVAPAEGGA